MANDVTDSPKSRRSYQILLGLFLVAVPFLLWQTARWSYDAVVSRNLDEAHQQLVIYRANLQGALEKYEHQPILISREIDIARLFTRPNDPEQIDWVNRRLEEINSITKTAATYLMALDGTTLASSNWNTETSFVGKNFGFRPYFKRAAGGRSGRYFALGTTSHEPGYYLSHPVSAAGHTIGIVVVKVGVGRLETDWIASNEKVLVTDENGIIFISSQPEWKFRSLRPLATDIHNKVVESRQYSDAPLQPLPTAEWTTLERGGHLFQFRDADSITQASTSFMLATLTMPDRSWNLHLVKDMKSAREEVAYAVVIAAFALLIALLLALSILQRRNDLRARLDLQQRNREELERRVENRTADLTLTNIHLEREITDRRKAEDDLRRAQDELIQASKMAALGQMASGITHELNQPLAAIRAYAENADVLIGRSRLDEAGENLTRIAQLTDRLAGITGQLKVFSRKTEARLDPVSIAQSIADALAILKGGRKLDGVTVDNGATDPGLYVNGEVVRMQQVFLNLFANALDAMQGRDTRCLTIAVDATATAIVVSIRDTGSGINPDDLPRVFDPFFTTKEVGEGLGLGLSISYRIVGDFGGMIRARNGARGGMVFDVEMPRARSAKFPRAGAMIGVKGDAL